MSSETDVVKVHTRRKSSRGSVNKSQLIRDYISKNPQAKPRVVAQELSQGDLQVSITLVNNVIARSRAQKSKRGRPSTFSRRINLKAGAHSRGIVSLDALLLAKEFINEAGGIEQAKATLDALQRLQ